MVILGGGAFSYERDTCTAVVLVNLINLAFCVQVGQRVRNEQGATWKMEFKIPWRQADPPNHHDDRVDSDQ